jgi:hypothetical protein
MGAGLDSPRHWVQATGARDGYLRRSALVRVVHGPDGESGGTASYTPE